MPVLNKLRQLMNKHSLPLKPADRNNRLCGGVEPLEDRLLLTTFVVDSTADNIAADGQLTLREAITASNTNAAVGDAAAGSGSGDKIVFAGSIANSTITLTGGELSITDDVVVNAGSGNITIDADGGSRVFNINANDDVTIKGLTLRNGMATEGGAVFAANGTTAIVETKIVNNTAISLTTGGGGIFNSSGSLLRIINSDLVRNEALAATGGGGAIFNDGGTVNIQGGKLNANSASGATGSGGAILSTEGTVRVIDAEVGGNSAARAGGGIELEDGLALLSNATVFSNAAGDPVGSPGNGGGLHVSGNSARVVVKGGRVVKNTAALEGGGLWNQSGSEMIVRDVLISANVASGASADDGGGGIFNNGGKLAVRSSILDRNVADGAAGSGGGILSTDGYVLVLDSTMRRNVANRAGGAIEVVDGTARVDSSLLGGGASSLANVAGPSGSSAPGNGGAVHVTGSGTRVVVEGSRVLNNRAASEGGGLWNQGGSTMTVIDTTLRDNSAAGDAAIEGGGAIFNNGGSLRVEGSTIHSNVASGDSGSGGGIHSTDGRVVVRGSTITGNVANRAGGGLEIVDGFALLDGVTLGTAASGFRNLAGRGANPGNGGGLHVSGNSGTRVIVNGGAVVGNIARSEGGGLWNQEGSRLVVRSGTAMTNNLSFGDEADNGGGAIFNNGGELFVDGVSIVSNFALGTSGSGGGIFTSDGKAVVKNTLIDSNTASRAGGGVEVIDGTVRFDDVNINANTAGTDSASNPGNGGGVHVSGNDANITFTGGFVQNNRAASEGGGSWNQNGSEMRLMGVTVSGNSSLSSDPTAGGGGIFNNSGNLVVRDSNVSGNNSESSGGGIFGAIDGVIRVRDSIVNGNVADDIGGGILNAGELAVRGSDVIGNVAGNNGGGILTTDTGSTSVSDSNISGNAPNDTFDA